MPYFYTRVPAQWSPATIYQLSTEIALKPAGRLAYNDYPGLKAIMYFDTLYFISSSSTVEKHIERLREWIFFHSFVFHFSHLCHFFENGLLQEHIQVNSIDEVNEANSSNDLNAYQIDYDNAAKQFYFLHELDDVISYRELFEKFLSLSEDNMYLLKSFLISLEQRGAFLMGYDLFGVHREYWQGTVNLGIVESIIEHPPNCEKSDLTCEKCKKRLTHRQGSETEWRKAFLMETIKDKQIAKEYLETLEFGYYHVRHPTAHVQPVPMPHYRTHEKGKTETYDIARSTEEYRSDKAALDSKFINIHDVTRYLLLHCLFGLNVFPKLRPLNSTSI